MPRRHRISRFVLGLMASSALTSLAAAQEPSGTAVNVSPQAYASGTIGERVLQAPGDIFQGDEIVTGPHGQAQIRFVDNTRFVVGPSSRVTVDQFLFNPDQTARSVAFNAARGTFRFISGNSSSETYTVNTPTMTIGVRGSAFNVAIVSSLETLLQWLEEGGYSCVSPLGEPEAPRTHCLSVEAGDLLAAPPGGGFRDFRPGERRHLLTQVFRPFNTQNFAPGFKVAMPRGSMGDPRLDDQNRQSESDTDQSLPDTGQSPSNDY